MSDGFISDTHRNARSPDELRAENERLRAAQDAAIRILSDDRLPLQSRINDARAILARSGINQQFTNPEK